MPKYFLGANSGKGFYSLYSDFCSAEGDYLHLIKGGPGCGKSSFMRRIGEAAEAKGFDVEYILCSGDPDSLDGIYIPHLKCGYVDATAPHIIEPQHFGFDCDYVNLGRFVSKLSDDRIIHYTKTYRAYYDRAYSLLSAAASVKSAKHPILIENTELSRIELRAKSAVSRALGLPCGNGKIKRRFVHSLGCTGDLVLTETLRELCKLIYLLDNKFGLAKYYLRSVIEEAAKRNDDIIICPSPLLPDIPEAVIFPRQQVGFVSSDIYSGKKPWRHVRLDAMIPAEKQNVCRTEIKKSAKIYYCIMDSVFCNLNYAKCLHDELEKAYKPYVDFSALDEFTENEIKNLLA